MRNKYYLVLALLAMSTMTLAAQDNGSIDPEKKVVDTGASPAVTLEETTAAVSVISKEDIERRGSKNIGNSILGQGLGLISLQGAGVTSDMNPTFFVRGLQTLNDNNAPLILVDGIERDITGITPDEVESVVVLRDGAATVLYGYRGANGAIQITTKTGQMGTRKVKFTYDHGFNSLINKPSFVNGYDYGVAINEARANDGLTPRYTAQELDALKSGQYPALYPSVNWVEQVFKNTASSNNFNMEFSGGEGRLRYFAMLNLLSDKGFINNSEVNQGYSTQNKFSKGNLRINMDFALTNTTDVSVKILGMLTEDTRPGSNIDPWDMVYTVPSAAFPIRDDKGMWAGSDTWDGTKNPVAQTRAAAYYKNHSRLFLTDLTIKQDLSGITPGLGAFVRLGYDNSSNIYENHSKEYQYTVSTPSWADGKPTASKVTAGKDTAMGSGSGANRFATRTHLEAAATYKRVFDKNSFDAQLKFDYDASDSNGVNNTVRRINFSGWLHYGYDGKLFTDIAVVESGSNRLAPGTKWKPSLNVSVAWLLSKMDFMSSVDWVNYLKLRASTSLIQVDNIPENNWTYYIQQYQTGGGTYPYNSSYGSDFGNSSLGRLATTRPTAENAFKSNVGIDARLFGGLSISADAYYQRRNNIWVNSAGKYTALIGMDAPFENGGQVASWGTEIGINYAARVGEVDLNIGGNLNLNRSKILNMLEEPRAFANLVRTGDRVNQIYGMKAIGFFKDAADIAASPVQTFSPVRPGDIKYEDVNKDGKVDENDVVAIGKSETAPEMYFNFHLGAEWKGLGFYALFQGAADYSAMLDTKSMYFPLIDNTNISQYYFDNRWTPSKQNAKFPALSSQSNANNYRNNTVFLADRSFLKLRNVELYYNLPQNLLQKTVFVKGAKFYVRGHDLLSFDKLDVSDAEAYGTAQLYKSVVLGLSLTF